MPLIHCDKEILHPFLENADVILKEYLENLDNLLVLESDSCKGWMHYTPFRGELKEDCDYLPILKKLLLELTGQVTLVMAMISHVKAGLPEAPHQENIEKNLRRFHIPLSVNDNARLNVLEEGKFLRQYKWELGTGAEFTNPQDIHFITCPEGCDRIILMLDLFFDKVETEAYQRAVNFYTNYINRVGYRDQFGNHYTE